MAGTGGARTAIELLGGAMPAGEDDDGELTVDMFEAADVPLGLPPAPRPASGPKGGRPRGSRNRSTEQWRQFVLGRYQSPLIGCCEIYSRSPRQLAKELELYKWHEGMPVWDANGEHALDTGAAAAMQMQARLAALPYLHQRLPQAIEVKGAEPLGIVTINLGVHATEAQRSHLLSLAPDTETIDELDAGAAQSHDYKSHEQPKQLELQDDPDRAG